MARQKLPKELKKSRIGASLRVRPWVKRFMSEYGINSNDIFKSAIDIAVFQHPLYEEWLSRQEEGEMVVKWGIKD